MPEMQVKDVRKQEKTRGKAWISAGNARIKSCAMPEMQVKDVRKTRKTRGKAWISAGTHGLRALPCLRCK